MFSGFRMTKLNMSSLNDLCGKHESIFPLINQLNINKAHGADQISVQMIKLCGNSISLPLQINFTNIVFTGIFPDQYKMANVTPVHQSENKQIVKNYRPISLLNIFAKILESLLLQIMYNHFVTNNLISKVLYMYFNPSTVYMYGGRD